MYSCSFLCFSDSAPPVWGRHVSSDGQLWDCPGNGEWPKLCALPRLWGPLDHATRHPLYTWVCAGWSLSSTYPPTNQSMLCHSLLWLYSPRVPLEMPAPYKLLPQPRTPSDWPQPQECAPVTFVLLHPQALKSHDHSTKPLYVSVGHRISLEVAVRLTHHCCRFRIPEPIRQVWGQGLGDRHCHPVSLGVGLCRDLRTGPQAPV